MVAKKKKKIYLLLAGGTCLLDKQGSLLSVEKSADIAGWLAQMPELNILADIEAKLVWSEDKLVGPAAWEKIAQTIYENRQKADGFVVVSKIDQLINTALALGFLLQNINKSIIVTSSQVSGSNLADKKETVSVLKSKQGGLGLRTNLINAIQIADRPLPATAIMFGSYLLPATKAIFSYHSNQNIFASFDEDYWGKVDFGINTKSELKYSGHKMSIYKKIKADVLVIENVPGISWYIAKEQLGKYKAILVKADPYQELEPEKKVLLADLKQLVVIYNFKASPKTKEFLAISGCTFNVALVKTMWAVANFATLSEQKKALEQNLIGEYNI